MSKEFVTSKIILDTILADSVDGFIYGLKNVFSSYDVNNYTFWDVTGNIFEPSEHSASDAKGVYDSMDFGYSVEVPYCVVEDYISYFSNNHYIYSTYFIVHNEQLLSAVSFHTEPPQKLIDELLEFLPYLSKRLSELYTKSLQMDLYVDYQKKVDFIKRASIIFKAIEIDEAISVSLSFFMDTFSADAVLAYGQNIFQSIGIDESDMTNDIFVGESSLKEFIDSKKATEFFENITTSTKFNIRNMFFVYEETNNLRFIMFNTVIDKLPDKDFSLLVSNVVAIAVENAQNHETMTKFKVEEMEISHTVELLNRFVDRELSIKNKLDIHGVNYPARNAGGDFMFVSSDGDKHYFCVADVCGKGYSAAVFTVILSFVATKIISLEQLVAAVESLNNFLIQKNLNSRFITGCFGIFDSSNNSIEYISCGHEPTVVFDGDNVIQLESQYLPLGLMDETYKTSKVQLSSDNLLIFPYTDGLIEYTTLDDLIERVRAMRDKSAKDITMSLYESLVDAPELQLDDFTCIIMKS